MSERSMEGLGPSPEPNYLHVELGKTADGRVFPWHFYDHENDAQIPVFEPALTGILQEIRLKKSVYKGAENFKIMFKLMSGRTVWFIRTGVETTFSRGVLLTLRDIVDHLKAFRPILIYAKPGDEAVYGAVYDPETMEYLPKVWSTEVPLFPIIQELQEALGQIPQTIEQIRKEYEDKNQQR